MVLVMISRTFAAAAMVVGACGGGSSSSGAGADAAAVDARPAIDARPDSSVTYTAMLDATPPVSFGAAMPTPTFCTYSITLRQLAIELGITPDGRITRGHVQDLNVEATTNVDCTLGVIPQNVAQYTYRSSKDGATGPTLLFEGDAPNEPPALLTIQLSAQDTAAPQAVLSFQRTQIAAPYNWVVTQTLTLAPQ